MTHLFGLRIICGQNEAKNKSLLAHFSMAMNMPNSAHAVIIAFFLCIFHPSNSLKAAEIQRHNLKNSLVPISVFKLTDDRAFYQESISLSNLLSISKLQSQGPLFDPADLVGNLQSDTIIQADDTNDIVTEDFSALITGSNILARVISVQDQANSEMRNVDTINSQKYFVSSESQTEIDPETGYALSASSLEQEGTIFTFIQRQNFVAFDYVGSQTMSWDIDLSLVCKCGFSTLQPFDGRGVFEFNFKTGTADLAGFSNNADVTGGLTIRSTFKSPTINVKLLSESAQATIVTNQSSKQTIDCTLDMLVSGPSANETTGQFIENINKLNDFLAVQFIGK